MKQICSRHALVIIKTANAVEKIMRRMQKINRSSLR